MNLDNQRLMEIKQLLSAYYCELNKTNSESLQIQEHIEALEKEEKEILARCDVII